MWKKKKMSYHICIPPINKSFFSFSTKETADYFEWFTSTIYERTEYLSKKCAEDLNIDGNVLNMKPESLIFLWKWFLNVAETEKEEKENLQLDLQTEYIIRDIGMYLGETFNKNFQNIYWTYYESPKTDFFVNRPILAGFSDKNFSPPYNMYFEPIHMTRVQASKILTCNAKECDLFNLYEKWVKYI